MRLRLRWSNKFYRGNFSPDVWIFGCRCGFMAPHLTPSASIVYDIAQNDLQSYSRWGIRNPARHGTALGLSNPFRQNTSALLFNDGTAPFAGDRIRCECARSQWDEVAFWFLTCSSFTTCCTFGTADATFLICARLA